MVKKKKDVKKPKFKKPSAKAKANKADTVAKSYSNKAKPKPKKPSAPKPKLAPGDSLTAPQRKKANKIGTSHDLSKRTKAQQDSTFKANSKDGVKPAVQKQQAAKRGRIPIISQEKRDFFKMMGNRAGIKNLDQMDSTKATKAFNDPKLKKEFKKRTIEAHKEKGDRGLFSPILNKQDKELIKGSRKLFKSTFEKNKAKENREKLKKK